MTKLLPLGVTTAATFSALALIAYRRQSQLNASNISGSSGLVLTEQYRPPPCRDAEDRIIAISYELDQNVAVTDGSERY